MSIRSVRFYCVLILSMLLFNCKSSQVSKHLKKAMASDFYENQFTGVMVYNPRTKDTVFNYNAERYFTPASNTKIFTLYTALQYLPEKIPAFKYAIDQDTLTLQGTGDPSFLHPYFKDTTALNFIKNFKAVKLITGNYSNEKLGPGWSWEDYDTNFSPERSAFPMYGNVVRISNTERLVTNPSFLRAHTNYTAKNQRRDFNANNFFYKSSLKDTIEVPMVMDSLMVKRLWDDVVPNSVSLVPYSEKATDQTFYSVSSDRVYQRMMLVSDNFMAEQLLILASSRVSDTLDADLIRNAMLDHQLKDLKQKPRWVDGSGLSRYNLFTPLSLVQVLEKLYTELPQERLFSFFPAGGATGTLKDWYGGEKAPYIYAKSGSMGNNYCLSGYLLTNSGEVLIFSFMNNHYRSSTTKVKGQMQILFEYLRDRY